jgi:hypothetical protein
MNTPPKPQAPAKQPADSPDARYDVLIYNMETNIVDTVAGTDLPIKGSFHTVRKRVDAAHDRINLDRYSVLTLPTGRRKKGDLLTQEDINWDVPDPDDDCDPED